MKPTPIVLLIPIRTGTGLNGREHWATRARRVKAERNAVAYVWASQFHPKDRIKLPAVVTLTRISPGNGCDDDNLAGGLKGIRDQLAKHLGVDDGDELVSWRYGQRKGEWGVEVKIQSVAADAKLTWVD